MNKSTLFAIVILVTIGIATAFVVNRHPSELTPDLPTPPPTQPPTPQSRLDHSPTPDPTNTPKPSPILGKKQYSNPPEPFLDENKNYQVILETNFGDITIALFHTETPMAANNFAFLAKEGFYDGLTFHRIINGFMIQGGDPRGDGTGDPGYRFDDEPINRTYERGIVAYANSGPNTNGSQFFIMHQNYPLPPQYVIFGQVVAGIEVVDRIAEVEVTTSQFGEPSSPVEPVVIKKALLVEK